MRPYRDIYLTRQDNFQVIETQAFQTEDDPTAIVSPFHQNSLPHNLLSAIARRVCSEEGVDYNKIPAREKFLLVRFRCAQCGMRPLYLLDLRHSNKARCMTCFQIVSIKNRGKYGRIRKKIAVASFRMRRSDEAPLRLDSGFNAIARDKNIPRQVRE